MFVVRGPIYVIIRVLSYHSSLKFNRCLYSAVVHGRIWQVMWSCTSKINPVI